ncbi:MAG TPA: ATPase, T2SS/T4P/T4SS family, partial [Candidatus Limnocylindrales bacterium]
MADASSRPVGWALRPVPPTPRSIAELLRVRMLDAELAAMLWLLVDGRVPVVVVGPTGGSGRTTLLTALLDFLPTGVRTHEVAAIDEDFAWLPQATELGWRGKPAAPLGASAGVRPDTTVILVPELADDVPGAVWGDEARIAIRAASVGYGLAATIRADGLQGLVDRLRRPPVGVTDDELSRLGVVLVLDRHRDGTPRVAAAHYVRP